MQSAAAMALPCDTVLEESNTFVTVPSLGAIVPGWLLVVSRKHYLCVGQLSSAEIQEMKSQIARAGSNIEVAFGTPTVFEHGPASTGTPVGCGIDHLHIHIAPLPDSLAATCTRMYGTEWTTLDNLEDLAAIHLQRQSYMMVQEVGGKPMWAVPPTGVRQPLRRAVANMLAVPDQFDYRVDRFDENVSLTVQRLTTAA